MPSHYHGYRESRSIWRRARGHRRSAFSRRGILPPEILENRWLLVGGGQISIYDSPAIGSFDGVGFALNPVAEVNGYYNGQQDDNPSDYSVGIQWGDGSSSQAQLTNDSSNGYVLVKGSHIYQSRGTYNVTVNVTGPGGATGTAVTTSVTVSPMPDAASIPPDVPASDKGAQPLGDVQMGLYDTPAIGAFTGVGFALNPVAEVAGYYNGQFDNTLSDYHAQINWGDSPSWGTNVGLTLDSSNHYVLVKGSHNYQSSGTYNVTVYVTGPDGQTLSGTTTSVTTSPMPDAASIPPDVPASDKGSQSLGDVQMGLYDTPAIGAFTGVGFALNPVAEVAGYYNGQFDNTLSDYRAQINWGDSPSWDANVGLTLDSSNHYVLVKASHNYQSSGMYNVTVYVTGPDGQTLSGTTTSVTTSPMPDAASIPPDVPASDKGSQSLGDVQMGLYDTPAIGAFTGVGFALNPVAEVAGYYNGQFDNTLGDYHAQINWGDSPSWDANVGLTLDSSNHYVLVKGSHNYQSSGTYNVTVYVTGPDGQTLSGTTTSVTTSPMPDAASIPPDLPAADKGAQSLGDVQMGLYDTAAIGAFAHEGSALSPVAEVAGYYNGQFDNALSDYHAQINWGDTPSWDAKTQFTLDPSNRYVEVEGSHKYQMPGTYAVTVYVTGPDGQTVSATTTSADIAPSYIIGVVTPGYQLLGFEPFTTLLGVPTWVTTMSNALMADGYDKVIPFNWSDGSPLPGGVQSAATQLERMIISQADALISQDDIPYTEPINLHLIGHSRGVAVDNLALTILATDPNEPAQLKIGSIEDTMLDPHPANPGSNGQWSVSTTFFGQIFGRFLALATTGFDDLANDPNVPVPSSVTTAEVYYQKTLASQAISFPGTVFNLWGEPAGLSGTPTDLTGMTDHTNIHEYYRTMILSDPPSPNPLAIGGLEQNEPASGSASNRVIPATSGGSTGLDLIYPQYVNNSTLAQTLANQLQTIESDQSEGDAAGMIATLATLEAMLSAGSGTTIDPDFATAFLKASQVLVNTTEGNATDLPLSATGVNGTATPGAAFSGPVADFTDPDPKPSPSDYWVQINWGDGQSTAGSVVPDGHGGFDVDGTHTYTTAGRFGVTVTINDPGGSSAMAQGTIQVSPIQPLPPPVIIREQALFLRKLNKHGKPVGRPVLAGFSLDYSSAMNSATVGNANNYQVDWISTKRVKKKVVNVLHPIPVTVQYRAGANSVSLLLSSKQTFAHGGQITVIASPPNGVSSAAGILLDGGDEGHAGDNGVFTILSKARGITRG